MIEDAGYEFRGDDSGDEGREAIFVIRRSGFDADIQDADDWTAEDWGLLISAVAATALKFSGALPLVDAQLLYALNQRATTTTEVP